MASFSWPCWGGESNTQTQLPTNAAIGVSVTVSVASSALYEIDLDGITLPSGLNFKGINDLTIGQGGTDSVADNAHCGGKYCERVQSDHKSRGVWSRRHIERHGLTAINTSVTPLAFTLGSLAAGFLVLAATITIQNLVVHEILQIAKAQP